MNRKEMELLRQEMIGADSVPDECMEAYRTFYKNCLRPGISRQEMAANYSAMADDYDDTARLGVYNGPVLAADAVMSQFDDSKRASVRVMDVAAGTGRVGQELYQRGFRLLDAVDPSEGLMKKLDSIGLYTNKHVEFVGLGQNTIPSDTYDAVVVAGGMGEGHIPVEGIEDLVRMAKPGGIVVIVMRKEFLDYVEEYKGKFEPHMDQLVQQKRWIKVERKIVPNYSFKKDGIVYIYKVL